MLVTTADRWRPRPGTVISWDVAPGTSPQPVRLSLNQRNHVGAFAAGEPSVWLAAAFDVDGPIDVDALEAAYRTVVARHSVLQCGALADGGQVRGVRHDAASLQWTRRVEGRTTSVRQTVDLVRSALDEACSPLDYPAFWPAAISRPDRSTVVYGLDHLHTDAYSLTVLIDDLHALYDAYTAGRQPELPSTGSFVTREAEPAPRVDAGDPRLLAWHAFLGARDHRLPTFPLDLGLRPGERVPQWTEVRELIDAGLVEAVAGHARRHGATTSGAVLATLGQAVRDVGGQDELAVLVPVHTRRTDADHRAVGWYTTTAPVEIAAREDVCVAMAEGGRALAAARWLAEVPLDQVLDTAGAPLVRERADVFSVSYVDYRRLPGSRDFERRNAHHVSSPTRADDVQLWVSRTDAGLAVRARLPDTRAARAVIERLLSSWTQRLAAVASGPCEPGAAYAVVSPSA